MQVKGTGKLIELLLTVQLVQALDNVALFLCIDAEGGPTSNSHVSIPPLDGGSPPEVIRLEVHEADSLKVGGSLGIEHHTPDWLAGVPLVGDAPFGVHPLPLPIDLHPNLQIYSLLSWIPRLFRRCCEIFLWTTLL